MKTTETIEFKGTEMDVEFIYHEAEKQTRDHPGFASEIEILGIEIGGVQCYELLESFFSYIEDQLMEAI